MRVLKGLVVSLKSRMPLVEKPLVLSAASGGERQRSSVGFDIGYSEAARCIGKRSYLEPNSRCMQKPIEGVYPYWLFPQPKACRKNRTQQSQPNSTQNGKNSSED